jgi:hypothetical protein
METTRSDTSKNATTFHKTAVREFLRHQCAVTKPVDLTTGYLSETQVSPPDNDCSHYVPVRATPVGGPHRYETRAVIMRGIALRRLDFLFGI